MKPRLRLVVRRGFPHPPNLPSSRIHRAVSFALGAWIRQIAPVMPKGVKINNDIQGDGREARRGDVVVVNLRMFLSKGEEVTAEYPDAPRTVIDLGKRETIAGIRYGIEGMRAGGKRTLIVSPHLAYGENGLGEWIPPKAALRCEVELLDVHDAGYRDPARSQNDNLISVFIPGSVKDSKVRCQATLGADGHGSAFITRPRPDGSWRRCSFVPVWLTPDPQRCTSIIEEMRTLPNQRPDDCLSNDVLWSDSSEPANGITRDLATNTPCVTIRFGDFSSPQQYFSIKSTSRLWRDSPLRAELLRLLADHLEAGEIY
jgi:peptidylprolyl isomerase